MFKAHDTRTDFRYLFQVSVDRHGFLTRVSCKLDQEKVGYRFPVEKKTCSILTGQPVGNKRSVWSKSYTSYKINTIFKKYYIIILFIK